MAAGVVLEVWMRMKHLVVLQKYGVKSLDWRKVIGCEGSSSGEAVCGLESQVCHMENSWCRVDLGRRCVNLCSSLNKRETKRRPDTDPGTDPSTG